MALAFRRAVGEAEKAIEGANKSINDWYKPPVQPALVIDYDSAKAVEGVSTQNPNKEEKPKAITIVNWVKDNYNYMHSIWGDVKYKGDKQGDLALKLFFKHIEKVVFHFDDKSNGKKYNSYDAEIKGKELHITVHFDFENYPQQLSLKDEKNGVNISAFVWAHLNTVEHIDFQLLQESLMTYQYSALKDAAKVVKEKAGKDVPITIDFENIRKIAGSSVYWGNKPPVSNNWLALNFLADGKGLNSLAYAVAELCKDKLGKEAFAETFDSIVVHVDGGATDKKGTYSFTKEGKVLHCHYKVDYNVNAANWGCSSTPMAKQLEGML